jgi:hypothetical protein
MRLSRLLIRLLVWGRLEPIDVPQRQPVGAPALGAAPDYAATTTCIFNQHFDDLEQRVCSTEPSDATACPTAVACEGSKSRRPELDPACNPALASYRAENCRLPESEEPAETKQPDADTIVFSYRFGPDRKADGALTAWLEPDQDLSVAFALAVGEDERPAGPIAIVLLIDGEPAPTALSEGEPKAINELQLDDSGQAKGTLTVASDALRSGASSANLLLTGSDGKSLAQAAFTVLHGSAAFQERDEPTDEPTKAVEGAQATSVRREGEWKSLFATPPDADGNLTLQYVLTPTSTGGPAPMSFIAVCLSACSITHPSHWVTLASDLRSSCAKAKLCTSRAMPGDPWRKAATHAVVRAPNSGTYFPWRARENLAASCAVASV